MKSLNTAEPLTQGEESRLIKSIEEYNEWLTDKGILKAKANYNVGQFPNADGDWIMKVSEQAKEVQFNSKIKFSASFEFYEIVVLHEYFHLICQKMPSKDNVVKIKDTFGPEMMKLIDIEADFYTALFLADKRGIDFKAYLQIMYVGRAQFMDKWIRPYKFERFIGSILSVGRMFKKCEKIHANEFKEHYRFMPTIGPVYLEKSLRCMIIKNNTIYYQDLSITEKDLMMLKKCYGDGSEISKNEYINFLDSFVYNKLLLEEHQAKNN